ncbi:ABC transporter permease [Metasolibacillus meyeri]|uniref:ABC transporter permease n=1 Tax=Metasolibacillus meyeri TaxID=1071052 RepID=UPI000D30CB5D|nr:ABC transporter permease [Metasolibacillus meyeri]
MWAYFKFELMQFFKNRKNIAIYALLLFVALFYAIRIAPAYDPIEKIDVDEIEARYLTRDAFIQEMSNRDLSTVHGSTLAGLSIFEMVNPHDLHRLEALKSGNLHKYAAATSEWYYVTNGFTYFNENFSYPAGYYKYGNEYSEDDGLYAYLESGKRYGEFAKADYELSINLFEQRTAWQTVERLMKGTLPITLIVCVLLLAVDIVTKDRLHPTLLKGFPIAAWKKLIIKGVVVLIGSFVLFVPLSAGFLIIGVQAGFGHFQIPVPIFTHDMWVFDVMSLGVFLAKCLQLLVLWFIMIIVVVLLCSIVLRNEMINLGVGLVVIFAEYFYFNRGVGFQWAIENYPTSYIHVGQIVSKMRNFYYSSVNMSTVLGMKLLAISIVVMLVITLSISLNKRFKLVR